MCLAAEMRISHHECDYCTPGTAAITLFRACGFKKLLENKQKPAQDKISFEHNNVNVTATLTCQSVNMGGSGLGGSFNPHRVGELPLCPWATHFTHLTALPPVTMVYECD